MASFRSSRAAANCLLDKMQTQEWELLRLFRMNRVTSSREHGHQFRELHQVAFGGLKRVSFSLTYKEGNKGCYSRRVLNEFLDILAFIFLLASLGLIENVFIRSVQTGPSGRS
jgi:hypothetical protein